MGWSGTLSAWAWRKHTKILNVLMIALIFGFITLLLMFWNNEDV